MPSRSSGSGRETLPVVWEWSAGLLGVSGRPHEGPEVVRWPSRRVWTPSRRSGSGLEALPEVRMLLGGHLGG